jgi:hypothetical protein
MKRSGRTGPAVSSQKWAQSRNLCVYRLRGIEGALKDICSNGAVLDREISEMRDLVSIIQPFIDRFTSSESLEQSKFKYLEEM